MTGRKILKIVLAIVLVLLAVVVAGVVAIWIWLEQAQGRPPELAEGALSDLGSPSESWSLRLVETFPAGTPDAAVRARLSEDGFKVAPTENTATYDWGNGIPCNYTLTAAWTLEGGKLSSISGSHSNACW